MSEPPTRTCERSAGAPTSAMAWARIAWLASEVSGVSSEGFQTTGSPQTRAMAVFHDQTAAGKLKALMTPTTPSGCQVSISRWPGRSEGIVRPYSWRDRPTAKSQMSIISWTSPRASEVILPASMLIRRGQVVLVLGEQLAEPLDQRPARRRRHGAPVEESALRARPTASSTAAGVGPGEGAERVAVDGGRGLRVAGCGLDVDAAASGGLERQVAGARPRWGWCAGCSSDVPSAAQTMLSSGRIVAVGESAGVEAADVDDRACCPGRGRASPLRWPVPSGSRGRRSRWHRGTGTPRGPRRPARCGQASSRRDRPTRWRCRRRRCSGRGARSPRRAAAATRRSGRARSPASRRGRTCRAGGRGLRGGSRSWWRSRW